MFGFYDSYFLLFGLKITYYGLIIACGMALGVFLACKNAKKRGLSSNDILILACYVLPLAIIGARAYYVIFADRPYSFVEILRIWDGGLAVYGGVIGGTLAVGLYCLIHKKNFFDVADICVVSLILGQCIGRIGCVFAGCCYGLEVTDPNLQYFPFAIKEANGHWYLATMLYESLWNFIGFSILILMLRYFNIKQRGIIAGSYLIYYGVGRAWIEGLRGDSLYIGSLRVSQLLSIILIAVGVAIVTTFVVLGIKNGTIKLKKREKTVKNTQKGD